MTPRERVLNTLKFRKTDRPPVFATLTPQVAQALSNYLNLPYEEPLDSLVSTRISHTELLIWLGNDCVGIAACAPDTHPTCTLPDGTIVNEWGMQFRNAGLYNEFSAFPLAHAQTVAEIEAFPFPDPSAPGRYDEARETVKKFGNQYAIVADLECSIYETAWYLTGLEKLLMDLMTDAEYVPVLLDRIAGINTEIGKELIGIGADIIWCGDDFGSQQSLIMDPNTWRKYFKPRIAKMFAEFRKVNPAIKIAWHSCGAIAPLIDDFIEIGLDILNPLQPLASGMDPEVLQAAYGNRLIFFGGIDVQQLLPNGTPQQIKQEVLRRRGIFGRNNGYLAAPAHNIQPDTPVENILAMYDAIKMEVG